jgi:hypothetical protein
VGYKGGILCTPTDRAMIQAIYYSGGIMPPTITRRRFLVQSAAAAATPAFLAGQASDRPPNILSIICDQMRGDALGFLGHPIARTPNIDRLASEGVTFERCFVNNPVCLPSRKSAFSGRYPHEHGSLSNLQRPHLPWPGNLLEHMSQCGYRTGWVGKNHTYTEEATAKDQQGLKTLCDTLGMMHHLLPTDQPLETALHTYLADRQVRGMQVSRSRSL